MSVVQEQALGNKLKEEKKQLEKELIKKKVEVQNLEQVLKKQLEKLKSERDNLQTQIQQIDYYIGQLETVKEKLQAENQELEQIQQTPLLEIQVEQKQQLALVIKLNQEYDQLNFEEELVENGNAVQISFLGITNGRVEKNDTKIKLQHKMTTRIGAEFKESELKIIYQ